MAAVPQKADPPPDDRQFRVGPTADHRTATERFIFHILRVLKVG
jgi:hypothetical protein